MLLELCHCADASLSEVVDWGGHMPPIAELHTVFLVSPCPGPPKQPHPIVLAWVNTCMYFYHAQLLSRMRSLKKWIIPDPAHARETWKLVHEGLEADTTRAQVERQQALATEVEVRRQHMAQSNRVEIRTTRLGS